MKMHELLNTYPIAGEIVNKYYKKLMIVDGGIPSEFEEFITDEIITAGVIAMLDRNPRALVDVLDDNGIYATIVITYNNSKPIFSVDINGALSNSKFDERKNAEYHLLNNAMQLLNDKIS